MLKLFGSPKSRALRVLWLLEEIELPFELHDLDFSKGEHRSPWFLAINPNGKVPVLQDGDLYLSESGAICNYLAFKYADPLPLIPAYPHERAVFDQWMYFVVSELEQPLWTIAKHTFALEESLRVPAIKDTARIEWERALKVLETEVMKLKSPYLLGSDFTVCDIFVCHTLFWAITSGFKIQNEALSKYLTRCKERDSWQRTKAKYLSK